MKLLIWFYTPPHQKQLSQTNSSTSSADSQDIIHPWTVSVCDVNNLVFELLIKSNWIESNHQQPVVYPLKILFIREHVLEVNNLVLFGLIKKGNRFLNLNQFIRSNQWRLLRNVFIHEQSCVKLIIWFMLLVKSNRMESKSSATVQRLPTRIGCKKSDFPTLYGCKNMTSPTWLGMKIWLTLQ